MSMRTDRPSTTTLSRLDAAGLIRESRTIAGLTQQGLAERLGTKQSVISRWERGLDVPRVDTLGRILDACGFEVDLRFRRHDDVDRSQIIRQLRMTPAERAEYLAGSMNAISEMREAMKVSSAA
jgi:transcriptional regulator with XRE-family HTH domain